MSRRILLVAGFALVASLHPVALVPASAAPASTGDYCVIHVTGQKASGQLTTGAPRCYATFSAAMAGEHVAAWGPGASKAAPRLADFQIGLHCDGFGLGAPCTSVVGSGCTGGWLNVSAAWNNRISSTSNGCPTIGHFDSANLTGASEPTVGLGAHNLSTLNNKTTSIQYS